MRWVCAPKLSSNYATVCAGICAPKLYQRKLAFCDVLCAGVCAARRRANTTYDQDQDKDKDQNTKTKTRTRTKTKTTMQLYAQAYAPRNCINEICFFCDVICAGAYALRDVGQAQLTTKTKIKAPRYAPQVKSRWGLQAAWLIKSGYAQGMRRLMKPPPDPNLKSGPATAGFSSRRAPAIEEVSSTTSSGLQRRWW